VTRTFAPRLPVYGAFAAASLLLSLILGLPELAALGAPFIAYAVLGLAIARPPDLTVAFGIDSERAIEEQPVAATVEVGARNTIPELELLVVTPRGVTLSEGPGRMVVHLEAGTTRELPLELTGERWGAFRVGELVVRVRDRLGLVAHDTHLQPSLPLRVYPTPERLLSLVRPFETQARAGNQVSRRKGDGLEFADIRPFVPGDRVRRINWVASARRQALQVNDAHPERNGDVVLFLDSFAQATRGKTGTLDLAVRAAASLAREYLDARDRVGIVGFGAVLRWLTPSMDRRQLYRIVDTLLEIEVERSFVWKGVDVLPLRSLPPQALVVALTPLLDERTLTALLDVRARGFDLVVVDVSPVPFVAQPASPQDELGLRLWLVWRRAVRSRFQQLGVGVVQWVEGVPLAQAIEEVRAFRRSAHGRSA
jgi:uncharacterized protein (DUF58 family)